MLGLFQTTASLEGVSVVDSTTSGDAVLIGAGIGFYGDSSTNTLSKLEVEVQGMTASGATIYGGLVALGALDVDLACVDVSSNTFDAGGATEGIEAPVFTYVTSGDVAVSHLSVIGNTSTHTAEDAISYTGGYWNLGVTGDTTVSNVIVAGNTITAPTLLNAGVMEGNTQGTATYTNVTVHGNTANADTFYDGGLTCFESTLSVVNTTVTGNSINSGEGVGGFADTANALDPCDWTTTHSNVSGNGVDFGSTLTDWTGADGNLSVDPGFTDVSSADPLLWDLTLDTGSALTDAGDTTLTDDDGTTSDIGAYGGPGGTDW